MGVLTSARANQHAIELLAGLLAGPLLVTHGDWWRVGLAGLLGLAQPWIFRPGDERVTLENTVATAALGVPLWSVLDVVLLPLAEGRAPQWTVDGMQALFHCGARPSDSGNKTTSSTDQRGTPRAAVATEFSRVTRS